MSLWSSEVDRRQETRIRGREQRVRRTPTQLEPDQQLSQEQIVLRLTLENGELCPQPFKRACSALFTAEQFATVRNFLMIL
jgi:hypothetical protein